MTPTHYLLSASDVAAIHRALSINRVMAKDDQGNYTKEITPKVITEALAILQSAQGVGVVANISQLQNARMFTLTEGAGYDRFAPLYAIQGESK